MRRGRQGLDDARGRDDRRVDVLGRVRARRCVAAPAHVATRRRSPAKVTIKPPPARATQRFPVEWPVCLGTIRGAIKAEALDVSSSGLFVRPNVSLETGVTLNFSCVLDDGGAPIAGRAKVVRQIGEPEAQAAGLAPGYGFSIADMTSYDRERWQRVHRARRAARREARAGRCFAGRASPSSRPRSPPRDTRSPVVRIPVRSSSSRMLTRAPSTVRSSTATGSERARVVGREPVFRTQRAVRHRERGCTPRARHDRSTVASHLVTAWRNTTRERALPADCGASMTVPIGPTG